MNYPLDIPMVGRGALPELWRGFVDVAPFLHPGDRSVIERSGHGKWLETAPHESFDTIVRSPDLGVGESRFYFSLLPVPYAGDLTRADIFIVLLNPGFGGAFDFYVEYQRPEWRERLLANLRQDVAGLEFPNLFLDPFLCWTGAYQWWERKLRRVAQARASKIGGYRNAIKELSRRVACIEYVPYHSQEFSGAGLLSILPSAQAAENYVRQVLLPEARADRISLIVTRQVANLGFKPGERDGGLVAYDISQSRGAHLGPDTPGGCEILRRLRMGDR